uniref:SDR family oxidoreductase n=1 Tax=Bordetella pertussis TaxID=520 RepID=UPI00367194A3
MRIDLGRQRRRLLPRAKRRHAAQHRAQAWPERRRPGALEQAGQRQPHREGAVAARQAAGHGRQRQPEVSPQDFDRIIQVNLKTPFFLIQHLLPLLRDAGRIVNVSSMGTRAAYPEMSVYAPAKAGLEALTLLLASDLGARGITVNAVLPGATATDMNTRARDPAMADALARDIALGRVGQPEDIADIVAFLASDQARWITGQRLDATGGQRL